MVGSCISTVLSGAVVLAIALLCSACSTTWTPLQGAMFNPAQIFSEDIEVRGLRVNALYGKNASVDGLDVGLMNEVEERVRGVQLASLANRAGELDGLGVSLANEVEERVRGVQLAGAANFARKLAGVQLAGIFNRSESVVGVQIGGIVNRAESLAGLQIGLLNFNRSGPLPFFPIFNFGFAGSDDESDEDEGSED